MAGLAEMITREFQRTGQPGKQTTTVTQPDEGFDPSNILNMIMMLLMSGAFKKEGETDNAGGGIINQILKALGIGGGGGLTNAGIAGLGDLGSAGAGLQGQTASDIFK